jgi:uncharacterized protein involved in propanediol utilization
MGNPPNIDLEAIQAEVAAKVNAMTDEEAADALLQLRVKQKVQQKKYQSPERQKAYQAKKKEFNRLLKERAMKAGSYDTINEEAAAKADAKLAEDEADASED